MAFSFCFTILNITEKEKTIIMENNIGTDWQILCSHLQSFSKFLKQHSYNHIHFANVTAGKLAIL